jgi:hypothetical protein
MFSPEGWQEPNQAESPSVNLQQQIDRLTKTGVHLPEVVKLLGAEEYLNNIGTAKNPVLRFDVKSFIESRSPEEERIILPDAIAHTRDIILPPDEGEIITGSGMGFEEMEIIPRTARFIKLLSELNLHYSLIEGINDPRMMRSLSYRIFDIPEIKKITFVNDEEGNATFVVNDFDSRTEKVSDYASLTKDQLKELPVGKMTLVFYPGKLEEWAVIMRAALEDQKKPYEAPISTALAEEAKEKSSTEKAAYEKAPEGWTTNYGLAKQLGVDFATTKRLADQQQYEHPAWIAEYLDKMKRPTLHYSPELVEYITQEIASRKEAPEGWMTSKGLANRLGVVTKTIERLADQQQQEHPAWFAEYLNKGNRPSLHYSPELVEFITQNISSRERAPEGWTTNYGLAVKLGATENMINDIADRQKQAHPAWFAEYLDKASNLALHYSPELVEYITQEISDRGEKAPEGWMTNRGLANKFGVDSRTVKRIADQQQQEHPTWFAEYLDGTNQRAVHYSPELVEYITQEIAARGEKAPGGWITNYGLAEQLGMAFTSIKYIADQQRGAHPAWFVEYLDKSNRPMLHYSPELVEYITQEISTRGEKAPEGWMTNRGLADRLGVATPTAKHVADQQRQAHPAWFVEYLDATNKRSLHYSPELVKYITKEISARGEHAPEGWLTLYGMKIKLGVDSTTIQRIAVRQQQAHPEWFAEYLDESNNLRTYYSSELVEHITQEISTRGEKAPEGWMTNTGLAKRLDVNEKTVKRVVDQQRKTHPEWFCEYVIDSVRPFVHYSPELVEFVTKEISAREQAPEGWMTAYGMSNKFGVDSITVKRMVDGQRRAHPEWFAEYLDKMKRPMLHYSPELVEYMEKEISAREQAPEGWMTNNRLADDLGVSERIVKRIADEQQRQHPAWFAEYLDTTKKPQLHYSPELVEYITQTLSTREKSPEGWMTMNGVENKLGIDSKTIQGIANQQREVHPEWFADYLDETNNQREHFSPELVKYITKEITIRGEKAPEGWMTNSGLANKLGASSDTIKKIADQQQEHPEWFAKYLDKMNRQAPHYSPELVEYITQEIKTQRSSH